MAAKRTGSLSRRAGGSQQVGAAEFKTRCLELMDRVRETGVEYVVTKHGEPVAKLVPCSPAKKRPILGSMRGTVLYYERPLDPLDEDWDVNRD
jgi:prevent-host-death family protein